METETQPPEVGYYWVKIYNHDQVFIMKFNGNTWETFKSDKIPDDEIESYELIEK